MKKILITGVSGFAGSFLAEHLVNKKTHTIIGTFLSDRHLQNIEKVKDSIKLVNVDLIDEEKVFELIESEKPDIIFHLAALSSPAQSFKNPSLTINNNIAGQVNILEALRKTSCFHTRVLIVSSAEIYGLVQQKDIPIDEETPLRPATPYAVSKIAQDFLGLQYFLSYDLQIIRVRPFNHIGPRQGANFVVSSFAKQIAEIEKGRCAPVLRVGNLEAKRDFADVRDIVKAYDFLVENGIPGEVYNIGSGVSHKIEDILDTLLKFSKVTIRVEKDSALFRPSDIPELRCDTAKIASLTTWKAEIPLDVSLRDTLDYWRNIL